MAIETEQVKRRGKELISFNAKNRVFLTEKLGTGKLGRGGVTSESK